MKRTLNKVKLSSGLSKYVIVLESDKCLSDIHKRVAQRELLLSVCDNPEMLNCGSSRFENLRMFFKDDKWIIEMEAVEES